MHLDVSGCVSRITGHQHKHVHPYSGECPSAFPHTRAVSRAPTVQRTGRPAGSEQRRPRGCVYVHGLVL